MRVSCLRHVPFEGPAHVERWAEVRGHGFSCVRLFAGEAPPVPSDYDMLVVMGGPMSVHDTEEHPWLLGEKDAIARAIGAGRRVVGVCLGAQLVAQVLGAEVRPNAYREIGWFEVGLTEDGERSSLLAALPGRFEALHWHGDTFELPEGATWLAFSEACRNQAFEWGRRVLGLQFHLEVTPESLEALIRCRETDLAEDGPYVRPAEEMLLHPERFERANEFVERVLDALVELV